MSCTALKKRQRKLRRRILTLPSKDSSVSSSNKNRRGPSSLQDKSSKLEFHRTKGSVLDELDMTEQERLELRLKADLHQSILKLIKKKKYTPRQIEKLFDV